MSRAGRDDRPPPHDRRLVAHQAARTTGSSTARRCSRRPCHRKRTLLLIPPNPKLLADVHAARSGKWFRDQIIEQAHDDSDLYRLAPFGGIVGKPVTRPRRRPRRFRRARTARRARGLPGREARLGPDPRAVPRVGRPGSPSATRIAVALNGTIAGTGVVFTDEGTAARDAILDPARFVAGANAVTVYRVSGDPGAAAHTDPHRHVATGCRRRVSRARSRGRRRCRPARARSSTTSAGTGCGGGEHHERALTLGGLADVHVVDVHAGVAEDRADLADHPGDIRVAHDEHVARRRHVHDVVVDARRSAARPACRRACRRRASRGPGTGRGARSGSRSRAPS